MKKIIGLIVLIAILVIGGCIFAAFKFNSAPLDDYSQSENILISQLEKMDKGNLDVIRKRAQGIYKADRDNKIRKSHENPMIIQLYKEFLGEPYSEKAHELLHTTYTARPRM